MVCQKFDDGYTEPKLPEEGEYLCMRLYQSTGRAQTVVEREDALRTPEETNEHWPAVLTAMYEELQTWVKYGCISRKPRNQARNIIDVKWVKKWKFEQAARSVEDSRTKGPADTKRIIRARLTVRGFKDLDAKGLDNYASTYIVVTCFTVIFVVVFNGRNCRS